MLKYTLLIFTCAWLTGCDHFAFQDMAIKNARKPSIPSSLELRENLNLQFKRGKIVTRFTSILEQGEYKAIIETDNGVFYLAPKGGFIYKTNDKIKSTIGGIFLTKLNNKPYVWIAPEELNQSQWGLWASGENIGDMLPGFIFIEDRPWVEKDFVIPEEKISVK
jgi:hypothetical protein